jgi:hypothetical protein
MCSFTEKALGVAKNLIRGIFSKIQQHYFVLVAGESCHSNLYSQSQS